MVDPHIVQYENSNDEVPQKIIVSVHMRTHGTTIGWAHGTLIHANGSMYPANSEALYH